MRTQANEPCPFCLVVAIRTDLYCKPGYMMFVQSTLTVLTICLVLDSVPKKIHRGCSDLTCHQRSTFRTYAYHHFEGYEHTFNCAHRICHPTTLSRVITALHIARDIQVGTEARPRSFSHSPPVDPQRSACSPPCINLHRERLAA